MKHVVDKVCSCNYCTMIDIMWGDPLLNPWEAKFVRSVARQGWLYDYSSKQKACILKIFNTQRTKYCGTRQNRKSDR